MMFIFLSLPKLVSLGNRYSSLLGFSACPDSSPFYVQTSEVVMHRPLSWDSLSIEGLKESESSIHVTASALSPMLRH